MIYAIGLDGDSTFIHFLAEAAKRHVSVQPINLRAVVLQGDWRFALPDDGASYVAAAGDHIQLDPAGSYYCRIIDLSTVQVTRERAGIWQNLITGLTAWLEHIPGVVINRPGGHAHNMSKPLHEHFLRQSGFCVPKSLTSSNRDRLLEFVQAGISVLKPISGIRANCTIADVDRLMTFKSELGPVHLQRRIRGADVRAHVVGEYVHAELIRSGEVDYRNSATPLSFSPHRLPDDLRDKIATTTERMGLILAGWDFKLADDGRYWCLECNPMPGYDGYDRRLSGKITDSILQVLRGSHGGQVALPNAAAPGALYGLLT